MIDTCNYYVERDGQIAALDAKATTTTELVADHLVGARVIKGFNNIASAHLGSLARPAGSPDRSVLAIAGDDTEAKTEVITFFDTIGYDTYDTGGLAESWRFERDQPAYAQLYFVDAADWNKGPWQITAEIMSEALARATR